MPRRPVCIVIAGPNGAGKTTFAREFLPKEAGYAAWADSWEIYDNSGEAPKLVEKSR